MVSQLVKNSPAIQETRGLIPGSGRSSGEGIGYPLQYSWASLVAQMVKNAPAMWETWERHGNPPQYSCLENPHGQTMVGLQTMGSQRVRHN